jgi:hypothetical protein
MFNPSSIPVTRRYINLKNAKKREREREEAAGYCKREHPVIKIITASHITVSHSTPNNKHTTNILNHLE